MKKSLLTVLIIAMMLVMAACGQDAGSSDSSEGEDQLKIGLSVSDLTLERWQHDRDLFVEKAEELGAEVIVQSANGDSADQLSQIQNMLSQDIDVLVIIAVNSDALSPVVKSAKEQGVKVLAYDRLVNNAEIDAYVSFDNVRVGEMQAEYLIENQPEGNYFLLGGDPADNNAHMFREGQMNVLQEHIDSGAINVVGDQWADGWSAEKALNIVQNALTANDNNIDAIVATNDSTAGGAIQALASQNLAGEVLVSGQDANLAAVQRIAAGTQAMTVYKPIHKIAEKSAEIAVSLGKGEEIEAEDTINNGMVDVPFVMLDPVLVDQDNIVETVISDGYHSYDEVFKNIPEDERPPRP